MTSMPAPSDEVSFAAIPADFTRHGVSGAIPGAQDKFLMVQFEGRFYPPGCTPPELLERWKYCKASGVDLIDKFSAKLKPAIVKFTAMVDYDDACIATALCYVHSMLQEGKMDTNSVMCVVVK